jgi:enediyne biosynthesis protein E3
MSRLLKRMLRISPEEASFVRRGFHFVQQSSRLHLEKVGEAFLQGYHLGLQDQGIEALGERLQRIDGEFRGYGFEGAAMALDILDQLQPWRARRIEAFLNGPGQPHIYMVHVGIGWSLARWRLGTKRRLASLDPLLQWLAIDGFGFHEGYFNWRRYADGSQPRFRGIGGYGWRAFDQGLGRSIWFVGGADPEYIASAILRFPQLRQSDLWSGVGLACAYAGGVDADSIKRLRFLSGPHLLHAAQGAVFAAGARLRAGNISLQTELGCQILCGKSVQQAAAVCQETLQNTFECETPRYELWRQRIRELLLGSSHNHRSDSPMMCELKGGVGPSLMRIAMP